MTALLALVATLTSWPHKFERDFSFWIGSERVGLVRVSYDGQTYRYDSTTVVRRGKSLETRNFTRENPSQSTDISDVSTFEGGMPSTMALWQFADGQPRECLPVQDEQTRKPGEVCGERHGSHLSGTLLGEPFEAELARDDGPRELRLPRQNVRFVAEEGLLPLPVPRDLFAGGKPAGPLSVLEGASGARVKASAEGCEVDVTLGRTTPAHDDSLDKVEPGPLHEVARDATRGLTTAWVASRRLAEFVDQAVRSAPPELDELDPAVTWKRRKAGCVGHAAVFGQLASELGVPNRIVYGVLVEDGRLYPHAWSEVEIGGRYYPLDPSRGRAPVGPEHIPLARSDDADPLRAGRCLLALPRLRWQVTETSPAPAR